jgi:hypothetical protein
MNFLPDRKVWAGGVAAVLAWFITRLNWSFAIDS